LTDRIKFTEELLKSIDGGLYPEQIKQILDDQEKAEMIKIAGSSEEKYIKQVQEWKKKAEKHDKLIDDLNSRIESNKIQRQIELDSEPVNKGFVYDLELNINLMSAILNYDFFKGINYKQLLKEHYQLEKIFQWHDDFVNPATVWKRLEEMKKENK